MLMDIYTYFSSSGVAESSSSICVTLIYAAEQFTRVDEPIYNLIGNVWELQFFFFLMGEWY